MRRKDEKKMKTKKFFLIVLLATLILGCPKKQPQVQAQSGGAQAPTTGAPSQPPTPPAQPPTPPQPAQPAQPPAPNLSLTLTTNFLKEILGGLCSTGYQIYLGDSSNYIIFRELKLLQNIPSSGLVELSMRLEFSVKKYGIKYADQAETTIRLKLVTAKKDDKIMLQGWGNAVAIRTKFGETLDENFLLPRINKELSKGPLFEVSLTEIAHIMIPWPKLGDSARVTELNLEDASLEIKPASIVFHMKLKPVTRLP